ncbi:MAG: GntR family transcriptional regulator [Eubacteriales bacterium]|nr:GntR family transcriptional regulator [Eubacteriales bacterium]
MNIGKKDNTVQGAVYYILREGIMTLRLSPGTVMSTQEMANRMKVSRTPVREAFIRLQREGLVDIVPQKETMVSRINLKRVEEERFIRESLELAVVEHFVKKITSQDVWRLKANIEKQKMFCEQKKYAEFVGCDNQFHEILFEAAGQRLSWETIMSVNGHYNRIRVLTVQTEKTMRGTIEQHEKIVALIEKGLIDQGLIEQIKVEMTDHVKKLLYEKEELLQQYPGYFEEETTGIHLQL